MNVRLWKEIRNLMPVWFGVIVITLGTAICTNFLVVPFGYAFGCMLLCALCFGNEFSFRTDQMLFSQPVRRSSIWWEKVVVLVLSFITLYLAIKVLGVMVYHFTGSFRTLNLLPLLEWLGLDHYSSPISFLSNHFYPWIPVVALCSVSLFTLIARSALGGFILGMTIPVILLSATNWLGLAGGQMTNDMLRMSELWATLYSLACGAGAYCLFQRMQITGRTTSHLELDLQNPFRSSVRRMILLFHSPVLSMIGKELRLQQNSILFAMIFWVLWLTAWLFSGLGWELPRNFLPSTVSLHLLFLPVLMGSISIAEERQNGTFPWHLSLPSSAFKQWMVKVLTITGLSCLMNGVVYAGFLMATDYAPLEVTMQDPKNSFLMVIGCTLGLVLASHLASSFVDTTIRAIAVTALVVVVLAVSGGITIYLFKILKSPTFSYSFIFYALMLMIAGKHMLYAVWLLPAMTGALLSIFAYVNIRSADFRLRTFPRRLWQVKPLRVSVYAVMVIPLALILCYFISFNLGKSEWENYREQLDAQGKLNILSRNEKQVPDELNAFKTSPFPQILLKDTQEAKAFASSLRSAIPVSYERHSAPNGGVIAVEVSPEYVLSWHVHSVLEGQHRSSEIQFPAIPSLLSAMQVDMERVKESAIKPYLKIPQEVSDIYFASSRIDTMNRLFFLRAYQCLLEHRSPEAFEDLQTVFKLSSLFNQYFATFTLFGKIHTEKNILQIIQKGIEQNSWSEEHLAWFQNELQSNPSYLEKLQQVIPLESAQTLLKLEEVWNSDRKYRREDMDFLFYALKFIPYRYQNLTEYFRRTQQICNLISPEFMTSESLRELSEVEEECERNGSQIRYLLIRYAGLFHVRRACFGETQKRQAIIACALERYRQRNGTYPETLESLHPHYLNSIPVDVIHGTPFHYRLKKSDDYLLYSIGWNQQDDGGLTDSSSYTAGWRDWLWNPPMKKGTP